MVEQESGGASMETDGGDPLRSPDLVAYAEHSIAA
jgi:hypothetical protein